MCYARLNRQPLVYGVKPLNRPAPDLQAPKHAIVQSFEDSYHEAHPSKGP